MRKKKPITVKYEPVVEAENPVDEAIDIEEVPVEDKKQKERKCRICKRHLTASDDKYLCPDCKNTYGSIGVGVLAAGICFAVKNKDHLIKSAKVVGKATIKVIKNRF